MNTISEGAIETFSQCSQSMRRFFFFRSFLSLFSCFSFLSCFLHTTFPSPTLFVFALPLLSFPRFRLTQSQLQFPSSVGPQPCPSPPPSLSLSLNHTICTSCLLSLRHKHIPSTSRWEQNHRPSTGSFLSQQPTAALHLTAKRTFTSIKTAKTSRTPSPASPSIPRFNNSHLIVVSPSTQPTYQKERRLSPARWSAPNPISPPFSVRFATVKAKNPSVKTTVAVRLT